MKNDINRNEIRYKTIEGFTAEEISAILYPKPKRFNRKPEKVDTSSRTIPDDSFTIKELFERYQKGAPLPLGLERPVSYSEDPTHNDLDLGRISRLDLAEVSDMKKRVSDTLYFLNERKTTLEKAENDAKTTNTAQNEGNPPAQ